MPSLSPIFSHATGAAGPGAVLAAGADAAAVVAARTGSSARPGTPAERQRARGSASEPTALRIERRAMKTSELGGYFSREPPALSNDYLLKKALFLPSFR